MVSDMDLEVERKIWITAYLSALTSQLPSSAQRVAEEAVDVYRERWDPMKLPPSPPSQFLSAEIDE
jgi:hypothetical protein